MLCPVCENESENTQQCTNCGWNFVYFTEEPSEQEQNEYTLLLQNYRTDLFYNLAQQYYQNKQYEETIECCLVSCEHKMFENPLALLALTYKDLGNTEKALEYANISLTINQDNEMAKQIFDELNSSSNHQDEIIKLTPEILEKDIFETTEQYADRIKNLGYVEIGMADLEGYDADSKLLGFSVNVYPNLKEKIFVPSSKGIWHINLEANDAKKLYSKKNIMLIAKIEVIDSVFKIVDIKIEKYSFKEKIDKYHLACDLEFQNKKEKKIQRKKEEQGKLIQRQQEEKEFENSIPATWIDKKTKLEWQIKISAAKHEQMELIHGISGWDGKDEWYIPTKFEIEIFYEHIKSSDENIFIYIKRQNESVLLRDNYGFASTCEYFSPSTGIVNVEDRHSAVYQIRRYRDLSEVKERQEKKYNALPFWKQLITDKESL